MQAAPARASTAAGEDADEVGAPVPPAAACPASDVTARRAPASRLDGGARCAVVLQNTLAAPQGADAGPACRFDGSMSVVGAVDLAGPRGASSPRPTREVAVAPIICARSLLPSPEGEDSTSMRPRSRILVCSSCGQCLVLVIVAHHESEPRSRIDQRNRCRGCPAGRPRRGRPRGAPTTFASLVFAANLSAE